MKYLVYTMVLIVILGGIAYYKGNVSTYTAPEEKIVEKEVEVDLMQQSITSAQEAKKGEIEALARKEYDATYEYEMKKVELEVIKSFNEKLKTRQTELEKETKAY
jgi:hypothetical protein